MQQYLLGYDLGSSSIKVSIVEAASGQTLAAAQSPVEEMPINAPQPGWAEQDPEMWWQHAIAATQACLKKSGVPGEAIKAIGISYQMHGLVCVDKQHQVVKPSIIWCDSRAVEIGEEACRALGREYCLKHLLNSPGNFTASKLRWVKTNEPAVYERIYKIMLPGDFLAMKMSGEIQTTETGLSEGIFWDYTAGSVSTSLLTHYGIDKTLLASTVPVFSVQARITAGAAAKLGLKAGTPISYRAGDQPNNAFSLKVFEPGETAATAGTSGVIYSVTGKNASDPASRVNTFLHVNHTQGKPRNGVLLCVNGTGILNSWLRKSIKSKGDSFDYDMMNQIAAQAPVGSEGLLVLPFGNGAERVLQNKTVGGSFHKLDFNRHNQAHLFRAAQEGIVFSLRYGFDVLQEMGLKTTVIRAGHANMFLSPLFRDAFVNTIGTPLELYTTDGAKGAALGAGIGSSVYASFEEAFKGLQLIRFEEPDRTRYNQYQEIYSQWLDVLKKQLEA
jgi:xylulokinase